MQGVMFLKVAIKLAGYDFKKVSFCFEGLQICDHSPINGFKSATCLSALAGSFERLVSFELNMVSDIIIKKKDFIMTKDKETANKDYVKKQTLVGAVLLSLCIGFIGGTVYSSFKLASDNQVPQGKVAIENNPAGEQQDNSIEFSSRILKLEQYLEQHPKDAEAWAQLGHLFFDSNQIKNAIEVYEKSLAIEPGNTGIITDLGVMYRRDKQPRKAIEAFDKALSIDPAFETARFNKGIVLLHDLNDVAGGIKAWEELVEQNPMAMAPNGESVDALIQRMKKQK